jgi:hypothetical protein
MKRTYSRLLSLAVLLAALPGFNLGAAGHTAVGGGIAVAASHSGQAPIVTIDGGRVHGVAVPGGYVFCGLPYGAPPTGGTHANGLGELRCEWRPRRRQQFRGHRSTSRTSCHSCRRSHRSRRTLHRDTTVRSGPHGNDARAWDAVPKQTTSNGNRDHCRTLRLRVEMILRADARVEDRP